MSATPSIQDQYAARKAKRPLSAAARWRDEALASFEAVGFPTRKHEDWRYTDLKLLRNSDFDLVPAVPDAEQRAQVEALIDTAGLGSRGDPRLVLIDGHVAAALSRSSGTAGVDIIPLAGDGPELRRHVEEGAAAPHPLAALNAAFAEHGAIVRLASGVTAPLPVHIVFVGTGTERRAPQPRVVVELGEDANVTIVQHFVDLESAGAGWINLVTDVVQQRGSQLKLYRLQEHAPTQHHTSLLRASLAQDAALEAGYIDLGGQLVRNDIDVALSARGARAELYGLSLASAGQHSDNHVRIDHSAPDTASRASFRTIVGEHGHGVFNGKVIVRPGAQNIDAEQNSDNLLLSDRAEIDTKPELEIYSDAVKCSHGATIGELDEEQLFYLRSRGIDESTARGLLMFAFANVTLRRFPLQSLRERAALRVAGRLPEEIDPEELT